MGKMRLQHQIVAASSLSHERRSEMLQLMQRCYDGVTAEKFEADLSEKTHVILLLDEADHLCGFSTQQIYLHNTAQGPIRILFSGDTIITQEHWGTQELARGWCAIAAQALQLQPILPLHWLLISKGYRTYLYLPLFFRRYLPEPACESSELWQSIATQKFGAAFDLSRGIVRSSGPLTAALAEVPEARQDDPHVRYFLERNPTYAEGDELVCLAEVSLANTHGIGHRWLKQALS
jgi:hypothetical protein